MRVFHGRETILPVMVAAGLFALASGAAVPLPAAAQIVVPNSRADTEGLTNNRFPFLVNGGMRYQQVYNASQFAGPITITQIAFRPHSGSGQAFTRTLSNITINLSTTSASEGTLSSTFASNIGGDNTTVHSGALTLSSAFTGPQNGPKDFDILINLQTPFTYNPASGNLLIDVLNASPESNDSNVFFDANNEEGDGTARVRGLEANPGAATGTVDAIGLVTRFTAGAAATAAPEPATCALLASGLLPVVAGAARRRRGSNRRAK